MAPSPLPASTGASGFQDTYAPEASQTGTVTVGTVSFFFPCPGSLSSTSTADEATAANSAHCGNASAQSRGFRNQKATGYPSRVGMKSLPSPQTLYQAIHEPRPLWSYLLLAFTSLHPGLQFNPRGCTGTSCQLHHHHHHPCPPCVFPPAMHFLLR